MAELFKDFTNLYPVSKTLRFELIPEGETLHYLEKMAFWKTMRSETKIIRS